MDETALWENGSTLPASHSGIAGETISPKTSDFGRLREVVIENTDSLNTETDRFTRMPILKEIKELNLSIEMIYNQIGKYLVMPEQRFSLGYPDEIGKRVRILNKPFPLGNNPKKVLIKIRRPKLEGFVRSNQE
ncbi:hypothetical protein WA026_015470 [Henosepilachna vigintioctopunctata]|uniref:Uncharacterized protein n=1 Tax=Henosepilachna vigintioctopunctata TaxID=420089 RepID=A0AAW1ULH6_9CUCU